MSKAAVPKAGSRRRATGHSRGSQRSSKLVSQIQSDRCLIAGRWSKPVQFHLAIQRLVEITADNDRGSYVTINIQGARGIGRPVEWKLKAGGTEGIDFFLKLGSRIFPNVGIFGTVEKRHGVTKVRTEPRKSRYYAAFESKEEITGNLGGDDGLWRPKV